MSPPCKKCLASACLTGLCTRYDGKSKPSPECLHMLTDYLWIPVCPEQLGGLPTPRPAASLAGGDGYAVLAGTASVLAITGEDLSAQFIQGATMVLTIAKAQNIDLCLLKSGSPSCGLSPSPGVTAALLLRHGIKVIAF